MCLSIHCFGHYLSLAFAFCFSAHHYSIGFLALHFLIAAISYLSGIAFIAFLHNPFEFKCIRFSKISLDFVPFPPHYSADKCFIRISASCFSDLTDNMLILSLLYMHYKMLVFVFMFFVPGLILHIIAITLDPVLPLKNLASKFCSVLWLSYAIFL